MILDMAILAWLATRYTYADYSNPNELVEEGKENDSDSESDTGSKYKKPDADSDAEKH